SGELKWEVKDVISMNSSRLAFSLDGARIVAINKMLTIQDAATGKLIATMSPPGGGRWSKLFVASPGHVSAAGVVDKDNRTSVVISDLSLSAMPPNEDRTR